MSERLPWGAHLLVDGHRDGPIRLEQIDGRDFVVRSRLEFHGDMGLPLERYPHIDDDMRAAARTLDPGQRSDLASVPRFVRWFADPYGPHTAAALFHDHLISGAGPDRGALRDDAAADRYFRFLLEDCGVPVVRRWLMWTAVALRSRWVAGGTRRVALLLWLVLAVAGNVAFGVAVVDLVTGTGTPVGGGGGVLLVVAAVLPVAAGLLWGRQWGASIVAAVAAPWMLPPTVMAALGYGVYAVLEGVVGAASRR